MGWQPYYGSAQHIEDCVKKPIASAAVMAGKLAGDERAAAHSPAYIAYARSLLARK
jgi:hypothetical protein